MIHYFSTIPVGISLSLAMNQRLTFAALGHGGQTKDHDGDENDGRWTSKHS